MRRWLVTGVVFGAVVLVACETDRDSDSESATVPSFTATATATATPSAEATAASDDRAPAIRLGEPVSNLSPVVVSSGCTSCDGPPSMIEKLVIMDGVTSFRRLLYPPDLGYRHMLGAAATPDGARIVAAICEALPCTLLEQGDAGARTLFFESRDGGETWNEVLALDGTWYLMTASGEEIIARAADEAGQPVYRLPAMERVVPPPGSPVIPFGGHSGPVWMAAEGVILIDHDGQETLRVEVPEGARARDVLPLADGGWLVSWVAVSEGEVRERTWFATFDSAGLETGRWEAALETGEGGRHPVYFTGQLSDGRLWGWADNLTQFLFDPETGEAHALELPVQREPDRSAYFYLAGGSGE